MVDAIEGAASPPRYRKRLALQNASSLNVQPPTLIPSSPPVSFSAITLPNPGPSQQLATLSRLLEKSNLRTSAGKEHLIRLFALFIRVLGYFENLLGLQVMTPLVKLERRMRELDRDIADLVDSLGSLNHSQQTALEEAVKNPLLLTESRLFYRVDYDACRNRIAHYIQREEKQYSDQSNGQRLQALQQAKRWITLLIDSAQRQITAPGFDVASQTTHVQEYRSSFEGLTKIHEALQELVIWVEQPLSALNQSSDFETTLMKLIEGFTGIAESDGSNEDAARALLMNPPSMPGTHPDTLALIQEAILKRIQGKSQEKFALSTQEHLAQEREIAWMAFLTSSFFERTIEKIYEDQPMTVESKNGQIASEVRPLRLTSASARVASPAEEYVTNPSELAFELRAAATSSLQLHEPVWLVNWIGSFIALLLGGQDPWWRLNLPYSPQWLTDTKEFHSQIDRLVHATVELPRELTHKFVAEEFSAEANSAMRSIPQIILKDLHRATLKRLHEWYLLTPERFQSKAHLEEVRYHINRLFEHAANVQQNSLESPPPQG